MLLESVFLTIQPRPVYVWCKAALRHRFLTCHLNFDMLTRVSQPARGDDGEAPQHIPEQLRPSWVEIRCSVCLDDSGSGRGLSLQEASDLVCWE